MKYPTIILKTIFTKILIGSRVSSQMLLPEIKLYPEYIANAV